MYPLATAYPESVSIPISKAVEMIGALKLHELGFKGKGIKVAVLDTGVSQDHPMIRPNIIHAESMVDGESPEDAHSHGSWVASAIAGVPTKTSQGEIFGVAPEAKLIILKVLSDKGSGSMADVVRGMERAVELGADIVSMSLGSLFGTNLSPDSRTLNELASRNGVLFVTAAGNSFSPLSIGSPACAALSIGVGAVAMQIPSNGSPSTYSSKGPTLDGIPKPDISTYGGNVVSPGTAELLYAAGKNGSYTGMAGTSMATPIVSGALALLLSAGVPRDRAGIEELFARTGGQPLNTITGWGLLDVMKIYEAAKAGVFPFLSVIGSVPFSLAQPLYQLIPKPKPETVRLQIV